MLQSSTLAAVIPFCRRSSKEVYGDAMLKSNIFSNIFSHCNFVSHVQIIEFIKENARSSRGGPSGLSEALMIKFDKKARKEQSRSVLQGKIFPFILKRYIYNSKDLKELKLYIDNLVLNIFFGLIFLLVEFRRRRLCLHSNLVLNYRGLQRPPPAQSFISVNESFQNFVVTV